MIPAALRRITAPTALLGFIGNALLLLLSWAWLYIPDSHTWPVLFGGLLAAAMFAGVLTLYATILRRLYPAVHRPLWLSALLLAAWLLLGNMLQHLAGMLRAGVSTRAGYWNSQLSAHHRTLFPYERLTDWQNLAIEAVVWIVVPALVLPFAVETVNRTDKPWRTASAVLASPWLWLTVALAYIAGSRLSEHLMAWHPTRTVHGELLSLALRTLLVYCIAVALVLLTLAVIVQLLVRRHERWDPIP